jgi:hypothetical protein
MDISFLQQMIKSAEDLENGLEEAYQKEDMESFNRIRSTMINVQKKISEVANAL